MRVSSGGFQALESAAQRAALAQIPASAAGRRRRRCVCRWRTPADSGRRDRASRPRRSSLDMGRCRPAAGSGSAARSRESRTSTSVKPARCAASASEPNCTSRLAGRRQRRVRLTAARCAAQSGARRARRRCVFRVTRSKISISSAPRPGQAQQALERFERLQAAEHAGHRAEHAGFGAIADQPVARGFGPHAAQAGRCAVAAHQLQLAFVLVDAREQHRLAGAQRDVVEQELGGEVVAAVEDQVVTGARAVRHCRRRAAAHAIRRALRD